MRQQRDNAFSKRPIYQLDIGAMDEAWRAAMRMWPFLGEVKRAQFVRAWTTVESQRTWPSSFVGPHQRLSDAQVIEIRALIGKRAQREIADQYGVSQSAVSKIKLGKRRTA